MDSSHLELATTAFQIKFFQGIILSIHVTWLLHSGMMLTLDLTLETYHTRYMSQAISYTKLILLSRESGQLVSLEHG